MSVLMTDDEIDELFGVAKLSEPYVYANISTSSITAGLQVLLLPTVQSPTHKLLALAGLALVEGSLFQQLPPTSTLHVHVAYASHFVLPP